MPLVPRHSEHENGVINAHYHEISNAGLMFPRNSGVLVNGMDENRDSRGVLDMLHVC